MNNQIPASDKPDPQIHAALSEVTNIAALLAKQSQDLACRFATVLRCTLDGPKDPLDLSASVPLVELLLRIKSDLSAAFSKNQETIDRCELPIYRPPTPVDEPEGLRESVPAARSMSRPMEAGQPIRR